MHELLIIPGLFVICIIDHFTERKERRRLTEAVRRSYVPVAKVIVTELVGELRQPETREYYYRTLYEVELAMDHFSAIVGEENVRWEPLDN